MLPDIELRANLVLVDQLYTAAVGPVLPAMYSKIAVIELCGWIEECMDEIIKSHHSKLQQRNYADKLLLKVKKTFSFEYEKFTDLKAYLIGHMGVEIVETKLDPVKFQNFKTAIGHLLGVRNSCAHTHLKITATPQLIAPSVAIRYLNDVQLCLIEIEGCLNRIQVAHI